MNTILCQVADASLFDTLKVAFDIETEMSINVQYITSQGNKYRFDYDTVSNLTKEQEKEYAELFLIKD